MSGKNTAELVTKLALPLTRALELELVDVEFLRERGRFVLRVLIDREGGVRLEDCEKLNRELGDELDRIDPIPESYSLEVSSAGLERPLKKEADYIRFCGHPVKISLFTQLDGRKNYSGVLRGLKEGRVILEGERAALYYIPISQIAKANLVYVPQNL